ncbi:MAG TPA: DEAD/DEAH box helicase family protein, partial [Dongiaceae bacterium]|nr:DEAD/DEAH box helicase family protein [Dongiaceae bacterium]
MAHASSTDETSAKEPLTAQRLSVLLPLPLAGAYDYRADPALGLTRGDFVIVPLGNRDVIGVVWGEGTAGVAETKLRDVAARLDAPALPDVVCQFVEWVAQYTLTPPGAVLRMAMSVSAALAPPRPIAAWRIADDIDIRLTPERKRVLAVLSDGPPRPTVELAREAGVGTGVVKALAAAGALLPVELPPPPAYELPEADRAGPTLNAPQADAAAALVAKVNAGGFSVTALDGVTGAGKTEVYFEAIAQALRGGRQALVLLPEIALGAQWLDRFTARFDV